MNATCKRLLSWLVVLTMVLSMVPVLDLSNFAVTTKAAENPGQAAIDTATTVKTEIEGLRDKFAGATGTVTAVCPVCSRDDKNAVTEEVEWTPISGDALAAINHPAPSSGYVHYHYYLSDDADFSGYAFTFGGNSNYVCLNLNGKAMTTGNTAFHVNYGDRVAVMDSAETDGSITGTKTSGNAAAVFNLQNPNGRINIYGGNFKRSNSCGTYTNVVMVQGLGGVVNMYGGTIDANKDITNAGAYPAGVYLLANDGRTATFNMYGGTITGANSSTDGGSVCATVRTTFNMYGGTVSDGTARGGGNFYINAGTLNVYGGTISGGTATHASVVGGGNILVHASGKLHMEGGVVSGGKASGVGGNIAVRASNVGTVEISGGKIYGGTAKNDANGHNIYVGAAASFLTISGGEIAGDIITGSGVTTTLSGEPKIMTSGLYAADGTTAVTGATGLNVTSTSEISVTGVTGGKIQVTGDAGIAFSAVCENAATVAQYFEATGAKQAVEANTEKKLVIIEDAPQVGKFEPWKYEGLAYCPVCGGSEPVEWMAIDREFVGGTMISADKAGKHDHVYLAEDISGDVAVGGYFLATGNNNRICLNLNGKKLNVTNGRAFMRNFCYAYWKVMDTEGGAEVSGNGVFRLDAAGNRTVDVYGGTFKTNGGNSIVEIGGNGGTFNLHNGTLDASGTDVGAISAQGKKTSGATATINVYGGEIIGNDEIAVRVGSVLQAGGTEDAKIFLGTATFNMTAGSISGGFLMVRNDNTATISGGSIEYLTVVDGAYEEGSSDNADVDYSGTTTVTLTGAVEIAQLNIGTNTLVNIDGLAEGADIAIVGAIGETLLTTANTTAQNCIKAYKPENFVVIDGNAISLVGAQAAVKTADGTVYFKTVDEAAATAEGGVLEIRTAEATVSVAEGKELYIDNRGNTVTVTGKGTLYAMDAANDDYDGYGAWIVGDEITVVNDVISPVNGNRYITIKNAEDGNTYSAHRVELYLTHASLRTSKAGLYYKAQYKCDTKLAGRVEAYGIVFSVTGGEVHQDNFDATNDIYSIMEGFKGNMDENTVNGTSTEVFGIFKDRTPAENLAAGVAKIHATPYFNVDIDANGVSDNDIYAIGNVKNDVYQENVNGVVYAAMSLYDVLKAINDKWENYESAHGQVQDFYNTWADKGMSEWAADLANISGATA